MLYNLISGSYNYVICSNSDDWYRVWMLTIILSITQLVIFQLLIHVCYHGVFMQLLLLELTLSYLRFVQIFLISRAMLRYFVTFCFTTHKLHTIHCLLFVYSQCLKRSLLLRGHSKNMSLFLTKFDPLPPLCYKLSPVTHGSNPPIRNMSQTTILPPHPTVCILLMS